MPELMLFIGVKLIKACPMSECDFLKNYKSQDVSNQEDRPGYFVEYPDGYKSWSPKKTFEGSYREVSETEKALLAG